MKEFLSILQSSKLFSDISKKELTAILSCLEAKKVDFPKEAFVLRAGESIKSVGLVLSGSVMIIQEDIWGNPQYTFQGGTGSDLCRRVCLRAQLQTERERDIRNDCNSDVF